MALHCEITLSFGLTFSCTFKKIVLFGKEVPTDGVVSKDKEKDYKKRAMCRLNRFVFLQYNNFGLCHLMVDGIVICPD